MHNLRTYFAYDPQDSKETRMEKFATFLVAGSCTLAGCIWMVMYYTIFGWGLITFLPGCFIIIVGGGLILSHFSKNHKYTIYAQIGCIIYIPSFIQWSIGGVFDSGFVLAWAFVGPICALMFFSVRESIPWFLLYLINLVITVVFNDYFAANSQVLSENIKMFFYIMNLGFASTVVFTFTSYYVNAALREQKKAHKLLEANLQQEIVLRENEKLATLGKLSAGIAHELNNPAASTQRGAKQLLNSIIKLEQAEFSIGQSKLSKLQLESLESHTEIIQQRSNQWLDLNPIIRSDQESDIENWLEQQGVKDAWQLAPMLVNIGYKQSELSELTKIFDSQEFSTIAGLLSNKYTTYRLICEIGQSAGKISEIVKALKSYAYLDQAPIQSVDIHEGLNDTLVMLRGNFKDGIQVLKDFDQNLPRIEAFGSEINQVWTNIIDNAVSVMDGQGKIIIKTYLEETWVVIEISDTGPGIPQDIKTKIFDPFFTTKPPGKGTGLGLNISHNIVVEKHKGLISVDSTPGNTCFKIKLPLNLSAVNPIPVSN
jgi:signal transduction histidine kinase